MQIRKYEGVKSNALGSYKSVLKTSAATAVLMALSIPSAFAQITVTDADGNDTIGEPFASDQQVSITEPNQVLINIAAGASATVSTFEDASSSDVTSGSSVIRIDGDSTQDGITITNAGTLTSMVDNDEEVAIFIDNAEDNVTINNLAGGIIEGVNGVIFQEGDGVTINNDGIIRGTGDANEGVIYFDRDADSTENVINNTGLITSISGHAIGVDTLLGTVGGDETTADPSTFTGIATFTLNNSGTISNTLTDISDGSNGNSDAINFNGDPGNTSEGSVSGSSNDSPRGCIENIAGQADPQINCQINLDITNSGTISAARDSTSNAAIRSESDAVLSLSLIHI